MTVDLTSTPPGTGHAVQFFDGDDALAGRVAAFLAGSLTSGGVALVVAPPDRVRAVLAALPAEHVDGPAALDRGDLVVVDAQTLLGRFHDADGLDRERFMEEVAGPVLQAVASGRDVHVYGEMVALLWQAGEVDAALELEALWNELGRDVRFALLCGYPAACVADPGLSAELRQLCGLHTEVFGSPGQDLPVEAAQTFARGSDAPGAARRFVVRTLHDWGFGDQLNADAALVVTELTTNAVKHASSDFTVHVAFTGGVVRLSITDGSDVSPVPRRSRSSASSGRGLGIVASVAVRWDTEPRGDGKVVWAELRP